MPPTPRDGWWEPYLDTSYRDLCDAAHAAAGWQRRTTEGATPQGAARFTTGHVFPSMLAAPILGGHDGHHRTPGHGPAAAPAPPPDLPAVALVVPPAVGRHLFHRVRVARAADHRPRGRARHPSGPDLPRAGTRLVRRRRLPAVPHAVLARRRGGPHAAGAVLGRRSAGAPWCGRRRPGTGARAAVAALSVDERRGADVPLVPMGRAAARGGPSPRGLFAPPTPARPAPPAGSLPGRSPAPGFGACSPC